MSSSTNSNQPINTQEQKQNNDHKHQSPYQHQRSSSIFSSIISLAIPHTPTNMTNTSPTTSPSSSMFGSPNLPTGGNYSPTSSINPNSPHSSMKETDLSHPSSDHRRSSISGFGSLTNGFRWPAGSNTSNPIPIPNSTSPSSEQSSDQVMGSSLPNRRVSGGSSFRRPFELPHYSSVTEEDEQPGSRRGRSGSLFSSFGSNPTRTEPAGPKPSPRPRRKLSPMGERMLRDHPF